MRLIRSSDREQLAEWIEQDPEHRDSFLPEFWYETGRISFVIEDSKGAVMYVKLVPAAPAMRLYIQFCNQPSRVARAMLRHFPSVRSWIAKTGATAILFDTRNPALATFCSKAFGFQRVGESFDYLLPM